MEKTFNKVNGFIPTLTGLAVLFGFLLYMVAYFFIKGLDVGYGVSSTVASQQELVANGLLLSVGLMGEIALKAFWLMIASWYMMGVGILLGVTIIIFERFFKKEASDSISSAASKYSMYLVIFLMFVYVFITFPLAAYEKGSSFAQEDIKILNEKGCKVDSKVWGKCSSITYKTSGQLVKLNGLLLDKNGQEITIYLPKERVLRTFQLPSDAVIERNFVLD